MLILNAFIWLHMLCKHCNYLCLLNLCTCIGLCSLTETFDSAQLAFYTTLMVVYFAYQLYLGSVVDKSWQINDLDNKLAIISINMIQGNGLGNAIQSNPMNSLHCPQDLGIWGILCVSPWKDPYSSLIWAWNPHIFWTKVPHSLIILLRYTLCL